MISVLPPTGSDDVSRDPFCQRDRWCVRPDGHAGDCEHTQPPPASAWDDPYFARRLLRIQYGRHDVDYATWYSDWMKRLAREHTLRELVREIEATRGTTQMAAAAHGRAIRATHSMTAQSQRRAQTKNVMVGSADRLQALTGALEIHVLFPEHARQPSEPS